MLVCVGGVDCWCLHSTLQLDPAPLQVIVLLKALCGGSNIDIDTAASNRGAKPKGSGAQRSSAGSAAGTFGQYPAVKAIKKSLAPFWGDSDSQRIMLGAVVMFVALM